MRTRRVRVGGRCTGSTQNVAALNEARDFIGARDCLLAESDNLDSLTTVLHHSQLLFVAQQVKHLHIVISFVVKATDMWFRKTRLVISSVIRNSVTIELSTSIVHTLPL